MKKNTVHGKSIENAYPLSPMQQGMLFHTLSDPKSGVYVQQLGCVIQGNLDISIFNKAWQRVVARHPVLRTAFAWKNVKQPIQVVGPQVPLVLDLQDWRKFSLSNQQEKLEEYLKIDRTRGFDLSQAPLMRLALFQTKNGDYQFVWSHHHILLDGWSTALVLKEVLALYEALSQGREIQLEKCRPYGDYIAWLQKQDASKAEQFWRNELKGFFTSTPLAVDRVGADLQKQPEDYHEQVLKFSAAETKALESWSRKNQLTLNTLIQGAWAILLSRYSGQEDVVFGVITSGRPPALAGVESMVGLFINTLPLRATMPSDGLILPFLRKLQDHQSEIRQFEYSPLTKIQGWSEVPRGKALFESVVLFENYPVNESLQKMKGSLKVSQVRVYENANYPLWLVGIPGQNLSLRFSYDPYRFDSAPATRMVGHFQTLLDSIIAGPDQAISALPILTQPERDQILIEWNKTEKDYPKEYSFPQLFEGQVKEHPKRTALLFDGRCLTYGELNVKANQLAHHLKHLGIGPEILVGICVEKSLEMVIGLLGILKAGGAFVPIDPTYPKERIEFILKDTKAPVIVTQKNFVGRFPEEGVKVVDLDDEWEEICKESRENPIHQTKPENLAYVIYTSGSTGTPKGVQVEHRSLINFIQAAAEEFQLTPNDRVLQFASISFDAALEEIFPTLTTGATLVLRTEAMLSSAPEFFKNCRNWSITILDLPTVYWHELATGLSEENLELPPTIRLVIIGGERARPEQLDVWQKHVGGRVRLINGYGPTEATIVATMGDLPTNGNGEPREVPIGRPVANVQAYVLDRYLNPVPIGVPGELHIGGMGLARGYLKHPALTEEKFIPNPFSEKPESRLYRTGDLVRYLPDGSLEYVGRIDHQVKIRGFRIELGELETILGHHPQVEKTVVMAREDQPGQQRLVAYVVPNPEIETPAAGTSGTESSQEQVSEWRSFFDDFYSELDPEQKANFYIRGWNSSYTKQPIPDAEVREWMDQTVDRVLSLNPRQVLEIGCGTGLMIARVAPSCEQYLATDISENALKVLKNLMRQWGKEIPQVTLGQRGADDFSGISDDFFDSVIIVSVIQYFPNVDYLLKVMEGAVKSVKPGGSIFISDVRSLPLLEAFHASVQLYQAPDTLSKAELLQRVERHHLEEKQLVIDPAFFYALKERFPKVSQVEVLLERGHFPNELSKFRYDVILHIGKERFPQVDLSWRDWESERLTIKDIRRVLQEDQPEILGISRIPNARIIQDVEALKMISNSEGPETVGEIREVLSEKQETGINPEDLWALEGELPYFVDIAWLDGRPDGSFDIIFQRKSKPKQPISAFFSKTIIPRPWNRYANNPIQGESIHHLEPRLRSYLKEKLPDYMIPSAFVFLDKLPLTSGGKVDRNSLPAPEKTRPGLESTYVAPRTPTEEILAEIFSQVLGLEQVGINNNFFELGGDSILSIQIVSRANQANLHLTPKDLFKHQTVAKLATVVGKGETVEAEQGPVTGPVPLTPIQHWFFEQDLSEPHHWNQAVLLEVKKPLNPQFLEEALGNLITHHDALRLRFNRNKSAWEAFNSNLDGNTPFNNFDWSGLSNLELDRGLKEATGQLQASLNLSEGPLLQMAYFNLGPERPGRLFMAVHHLVIDGVSWRILLEDFQTVYQQINLGEKVKLSPKTTSFKYWSEQMGRYAKSEEIGKETSYWLSERWSKFSSRLPVDFPGGMNIEASAQTVTVLLTLEETRVLLQEVPKVYHTQINDVLLTALAKALSQWTGEKVLLIDLEGHGRESIAKGIDVSRTIGWFTSLFPVFLELQEGDNPGETLKSIKEQLRRIPNNGVGYGILRYLSEDQETIQKLKTSGQAEVSFNYLGQFDSVLSQSPLFGVARESIGPSFSPREIRSHLLNLHGRVIKGQFELSWTYCENLHRRSTIDELAKLFVNYLKELIKHCLSPEAGGYTPSDFSLAQLDEQKLRKIASQIEKVDRHQEKLL